MVGSPRKAQPASSPQTLRTSGIIRLLRDASEHASRIRSDLKALRTDEVRMRPLVAVKPFLVRGRRPQYVCGSRLKHAPCVTRSFSQNPSKRGSSAPILTSSSPSHRCAPACTCQPGMAGPWTTSPPLHVYAVRNCWHASSHVLCWAD